MTQSWKFFSAVWHANARLLSRTNLVCLANASAILLTLLVGRICLFQVTSRQWEPFLWTSGLAMLILISQRAIERKKKTMLASVAKSLTKTLMDNLAEGLQSTTPPKSKASRPTKTPFDARYRLNAFRSAAELGKRSRSMLKLPAEALLCGATLALLGCLEWRIGAFTCLLSALSFLFFWSQNETERDAERPPENSRITEHHDPSVVDPSAFHAEKPFQLTPNSVWRFAIAVILFYTCLLVIAEQVTFPALMIVFVLASFSAGAFTSVLAGIRNTSQFLEALRRYRDTFHEVSPPSETAEKHSLDEFFARRCLPNARPAKTRNGAVS